MSTPDYAALPAREREMLRLYVEGLSLRAVAERCHYSKTRVVELLEPLLTPELKQHHRHNQQKNRQDERSQQKNRQDERSHLHRSRLYVEMLRLYVDEGMTYRAIAERSDYSKSGVCKLLQPLLTPELKQRHKSSKRKQQEKLLEATQPRFVKMVEGGIRKPTIIRELNLTQSQFTWLAHQLDPAVHKRWAAAGSGGESQYSEAVCWAAAKRVYDECGGRMSTRDYNARRRPNEPSSRTIVSRLDMQSWSTLREALRSEMLNKSI